MVELTTVLAVVPARGGSKGVQRKNLRKLRGKTLVAITAEVISQVPEIDVGVISTDDEEIALEGERGGLLVPFLRPRELSGDYVSDADVLIHALEKTESYLGRVFDIVIMLQPTSPLRRPEHVSECIRRVRSGTVTAAWTISPVDKKYHPLKQLTCSASGMLDFTDREGAVVIARQQLNGTFVRNGAAYAISREVLLKQRHLMSPKTAGVLIDDEMVSIDTEDDFLRAEELLNCGASGGQFGIDQFMT